MEVMLVEDLNDIPDNISKIKVVLDNIGCDRIYVNVPIRPPAEDWVKIPSKQRILAICNELNAYNIAHYEAIQGIQMSDNNDMENQILKITTRHPLRESQILAMFDLPDQEIIQILQDLARKGILRRVIHNNQVFWINASSKIKSE